MANKASLLRKWHMWHILHKRRKWHNEPQVAPAETEQYAKLEDTHARTPSPPARTRAVVLLSLFDGGGATHLAAPRTALCDVGVQRIENVRGGISALPQEVPAC